MATQAELAAASAAWLAANHPDWNQNSSSAAQAAATNAAYLSNTLPVTPQYAPGGGAKYTPSEIADAASEAAKYQYFNSPINYAAYANTPLSQMPSNIASRVQDYYAAHPSAAAQDITSKYNANIGTVSTGGASYRQGSFTPTVEAGAGGFTGRAADYAKNFVPLSTTLDTQNTRAVQQGQLGIDYASVSGLSNPFNPNSAAGIMWDVARTGGTVGLSLAAAALPEFVKAGVSEVPKSWVSADTGISTIPTPVLDTSKWFQAPVTGTTIPGQDMYFRIGDTGKTQLKENAKMIYAESGAFDLLQVVPNNIPGSNFTRIYPWITAGGSDNALQGSAVTGKPLVTIDGKQSNALVYDEYGLNKMWDTNTVEGSIANQILSGIGTYSKAGRELYGGTVQPVDNRTMQSEFEKGNLVMPGVYSPAIQSYANLVTVAAENAPKGTIASEANLPKFGEIGAAQFASMPAIQKVDLSGNLSPAVSTGKSDTGRLTGSKVVTSESSIANIGEADAKAPFVSARYTAPEVITETIQPTGELFGLKIPVVSDALSFFQQGKEVTTSKGVTALPEVTTLTGTTTTTLPETKSLKSTDVSYDSAGNKITTYNYEVSGGTQIVKEFTTTGGKTTTTSTFEKSTPSGYDSWLAGANKQVSQNLGFNLLPEVTTEQIKAMTPYISAFGGAAALPASIALKNPITSDYVASYEKGEVTAMKETPVNALVMSGIGFVTGGIFKGATTISEVSRASLAEKAISSGGAWRAAEQFSANAVKYTGNAMAGLYALDVGARATNMGTDFSPASAERLGSIVAIEARPMTAGAMIGYSAPGKIYDTIKTSDINYKAALEASKGEPAPLKVSVTPNEPPTISDYMSRNKWNMDTSSLDMNAKATYKAPEGSRAGAAGWGVPEPTTTGRFDWYVKQPVTQAVARPVSAIRGDYASFIMEAEAKTPSVVAARPGMSDYILSKASAGRYGLGGQYGEPISPEPVTIKAPQRFVPTEYGLEPISTEYGSEIARAAYGSKIGKGTYTPTPAPEVPSLGKKVTAWQGGVWSTKYIEPTAGEVITGEVAARAYGKQPTLAESAKSGASYISDVLGFGKETPAAPRDWYTSESLSTSEIYGTQPIDIALKSYLQENPISVGKNLRMNLIRPSVEIANINRATHYDISEVFRENSPAWKSSLNIFGKVQPTRYGVAIERPAEAKTPTGSTETRTKTGLSLLSRTEEVSIPQIGEMTGVETGISGLPVWPSGPSPVQKQRYTVEEETQYFTLPPGTVSPGPKIETTQTITQIYTPASMVTQKQAQEQRVTPLQSFISDTITKQETDRVTKQSEVPTLDYVSLLDTSSVFKQIPSSEQSRDVWQTTTTIPKQETTLKQYSAQETKQTQKQSQDQITKPWQDTIKEITTAPPVSLPSWNGSGGGSSGSKGGFSRSYENRFLYGEGVGILDFSSGLHFGRSVPRRTPKRAVSTGKIKFRGRGR